MPRAVPNSRVTSLSAEATPCLSRGNEPVMASVDGVIDKPMPMPMATSPGRIDK